MDFHPSRGEAQPRVRLPIGLPHGTDPAESLMLPLPSSQSPGACPLKMSTEYRRRRTRLPIHMPGKTGQ